MPPGAGGPCRSFFRVFDRAFVVVQGFCQSERLAASSAGGLTPRMFSTWLWRSSRSSTTEAITLSPSSSPHSPKPWLEVRMMLALS